MASIRYLKKRKRWQVRWHITNPEGRVDVGSKLLPRGFTRPDAEREQRKYEQLAQDIKYGRRFSPESIGNVVPKWLIYNQRHTERTQKLYQRVIGLFVAALPSKVRFVEQVSSRHIHDYLAGMHGRKLSNRTCNTHLTIIKSFCRWLAEIYQIDNVAAGVKMLKQDPPKQRFLTPAEFATVMAIGDECFQQRAGFIARTGLRATEFCSLTWSCVNYDDIGKMASITITGKGRKRRTIPLNDAAQKILLELNASSPNNNTHIFISKSSKKSMRGKPIGRKAFLQMCIKVANQAGVPHFGPHALRHWFATQLLLKGVPIAHVSRLLGHSSIKTTENIYIHFLPTDLAGVTDCLG